MYRHSSSKNGGFALVIALSLMAFVLLLLLSISTIVQVEQSSAAINKAQLQAEQSALLALNQALGALQAEMGPDQRISANADILNDSRNENAKAVNHPYLVGTWDTSGDASRTTVSARVGQKWEIGDTVASNYYENRARNGFRRWLISDDGSGDMDTSSMDFAEESSFKDSDDAFKAVGTGTLGSTVTNQDNKEIWAPLQKVSSGTSGPANARIGWVVLDENVKAKMNQPNQLAANSSSSNTVRAEDLVAWDNPGDVGIEAISDLSGFNRGNADVGKVTSFATASLYMSDAVNGSVSADTFGSYFHDLSFHSAGVMADVVNGGLKRDLSTLAEELPASYTAGRRLYSDTTSGHGDNENADPHWSAILDYISLYKERSPSNSNLGDIARLEQNGNSLPVAQMNTTEWAGNRSDRASVDEPFPAPTTYRLAPAVAQFETYFSFLALRPHTTNFITGDRGLVDYGGLDITRMYANQSTGSWQWNDDTRHLHMCVTPVITLYNPYSVPIEFKEMWVVFRDIPVGFRFSRYNQGDNEDSTPVNITNDFVPLAAMNSKSGSHINFAADGSQRFRMRLSSDADASNSNPEPVKLAPGETIVFSPYYPPGTTVNELDNWNSEKNGAMEAKPGYSDGVGLYWDGFSASDRWASDPVVLGRRETGRGGDYILEHTAFNASYDNWFIYMNELDQIRVEVAYVDGTENPTGANQDPPSLERNGTFSVELFSQDPQMLVPGSDGSDSANMIGRYTFDYNTGTSKGTDSLTRKGLLGDGAPLDQETEIIARRLMNLDDLYQSDYTRKNATVEQVEPVTFAAFRVGGKVTQQVSGEPFQPAVASAFTNTSVLSGHYNVGEESPAFGSFDLSIRTPENGDPILIRPEVDTSNNNRGRFFSGYTSIAGSPFGTQLEVPVTPLQSIGSLQHANIAASGYLPHVSHAVGNSWAHPLIASDSAVNTSGDYGLFDHSYIANTQLWDSYYFSTMADQQLAWAGTGDSYDTTVRNFIQNGDALPNSTFKRHIPLGKDAATATTELTNGSSAATDAYLKAAAYQLQEGTFNINSTSIEAWKAILSTANIASPAIKQPIYSDPNSSNSALTFNTGSGSLEAIYSRYRIANYDTSFDSATTDQFAIWQGYRSLDEDIINQLASDIVDEIRTRGPFLSLAEFVNRRLGPDGGDTKTQMGTIDAAIAESSSNTSINDTLIAEVGADISGSIESHITSKDFGSMIENSDVVSGNTARGITSYLTQADILQQVGSRLSARSDTFVIRAYGEVYHPLTGEVTANSLCEAVVQRIPDYVDSSQEPYFDDDLDTPEPDGLNETNEQFGRRFKVVQLNWLNPNDV